MTPFIDVRFVNVHLVHVPSDRHTWTIEVYYDEAKARHRFASIPVEDKEWWPKPSIKTNQLAITRDGGNTVELIATASHVPIK